MFKNNKKVSVLLIEDEEYDVRRIRRTLAPFSEHVVIKDVVSDGQAALELLKQRNGYDVVIMDFQIYGGLKGEKLIRMIKEISPTLQIIVVTKMTMNVTDFEFANKLLDAGAMWYCTKYPGDIEEYIYQPTDFVLSIFNAYEKKKLEDEKIKSNRKLQKNIQDILEKKRIIGESPEMAHLNQQIEKCARTNTTVLILGSSGTGKEIVAENIHYRSERRLEHFVPINCGSLPDHLIESELFGFEKGSFTGADVKKQGLFEIANKGTIFLDEISELPLSAQAKLLRVIQEGEIDKIGRTDKVEVDVRVMAATNKDLQKQVQEKRFREDLFYRLNVFFIHVPRLAERRDDISLLITYFLQLYSESMNAAIPEIDDDVMTMLYRYDWPGNVRQLQNVVQRFLLSGLSRIDLESARHALGIAVGHTNQSDAFFNKEDIRPWRETEESFQEKYFRFVRDHTSSDAEAARKLGLAPPNYHRMCKRLGLK